MNNLNNEWPISPTFLSLRQGCTEENANYNTDGIFYTDYLRGFLADLSHDKRIQNALSLFQFVPEDFIPLDPNAGDENHILVNSTNATVKWNYPVDERIAPMLDNRKIIRIDSGTFINNGKLCDSFRKCKDFKNTFFCFRQDSLVGIFAHRSLNRFNPKSKEYRDQLELIINDVNKGQDEKAQIKKEEVEINKKIHTYIHYTCPFSLFEEHIFPIYVQEHIIACLMFGQTAREKYKKEEAFYLDRDNMSLAEEDYNIEKIRDDEWEEKVYTIIERIDVFEQRLKERIEHRNTRFINDKFKNIEQQFRAKIRSIKMREGRALTAFSDTLSAAFGEIRENFDSSKDGFIRMFALKIDAENNTLVPIGWSDEDIESIMIVGPTGVGKTETAHTACKYLDIPFLSVNAANLNPEGYKGTSIEDALLTLYELANRDIYTAQRGLLFLDEFDKLNASNLDLKSSVKNILLTFTEGGTFRIEDGLFSNFSFNTKMLNKIYAGVFEKIALTQPQMGFQTESVKKSIALDPKIVSKRLIDKGYFTAEELTRISSIIVFDELDTETKKRILTSSKISTLLKRKKRYERQFGLELYFDDSFIDAALDLCNDKDGMRNVNIQIKTIMDAAEKAILDNEDNIRGKRLSLTKNTVLNPKNFNIS